MALNILVIPACAIPIFSPLRIFSMGLEPVEPPQVSFIAEANTGPGAWLRKMRGDCYIRRQRNKDGFPLSVFFVFLSRTILSRNWHWRIRERVGTIGLMFRF